MAEAKVEILLDDLENARAALTSVVSVLEEHTRNRTISPTGAKLLEEYRDSLHRLDTLVEEATVDGLKKGLRSKILDDFRRDHGLPIAFATDGDGSDLEVKK